jgi:glycosyltransferase involved in cell wall biosynthesis
MLNLAKGLLSKNLTVDLVVGWPHGRNEQNIPLGTNLISLDKKKIIFGLPRLLQYLNTSQPKVLLTAQTHVNILGIVARLLYRKPIRLIVCEHNDMCAVVEAFPKERYRPVLARLLYPFADEIVAVSKGVAESISIKAYIPVNKIRILHNPIISEDMLMLAKKNVSHPWFQPGHPKVVLAVGRLELQKDYETLLKAMAIINQKRSLRLVILGEGSLRNKLNQLSIELGIHEIVDMPGYIDNPYPYMTNSSVFVLSSIFEGFPGVLVEAMACGIQVVSTNCPSGPQEILDGGKFGRLVTVGDEVAMAAAIVDSLDNPIPKDLSIKRGLEFAINKSIPAYLDIIFPERKSTI